MEKEKSTNNNQSCQALDVDPEYRKIVEDAARKGENIRIYNSTLAHAVFLSQTIISKAADDIKILTGELDKPSYDEIKNKIEEAAEKFASSGKSSVIKVIIWKKEAPSNEEFESLRSRYENVIKVRYANQESAEKIHHFLVSDSKRYRIEDPHTDEDLRNQNVKGVANFGDFETAKILDSIFDEEWSNITN